MHAIDALYQDYLARRQLPSRDLIEQHTSGITDEDVSRAIAGRLACALPSAEALDYLSRHLRAPLLTVAAGIGFWAHCLRHVHGIETLATDLHTPSTIRVSGGRAGTRCSRWTRWITICAISVALVFMTGIASGGDSASTFSGPLR